MDRLEIWGAECMDSLKSGSLSGIKRHFKAKENQRCDSKWRTERVKSGAIDVVKKCGMVVLAISTWN
jgi:hypothetical protein